MKERTMQPDTDAALAMLSAFASVGVTTFELTITNVKEDTGTGD